MDCLLGKDINEVGYYSWDVTENWLSLDRVSAAICGFSEAEGAEGLTIEAFLMRVAPSSRERVAKAIHDNLLNGNLYQEDYEIEIDPERYRWIRVGGRIIYDRDRMPIKGVGWMIDITVEKLLGGVGLRQ